MGSVTLDRSLLTRRTKSNNADVVVNSQYYSSASGYYYQERNSVLDNFSITGYNIKDFHKRVSRGDLLPQTPFYRRQIAGSTTGAFDILKSGSSYHSYLSDGVRHSYTYWKPDSGIGDDLTTYLDEADIAFAQEAAAKIYSSGHDTLTFIAELTDVRKMFLHTGKRLVGSLALLPKGMKGRSSDWLSYRYGWRTLIYDLQDLNKAIIGLNSGRQRYSERAGTKYSTSSTDAYDDYLTSAVRHHIVDDKVTYKLSGSVVADVSIPQFQFNPLSTGWEIIPFSFVVDWFVNVGKALSAWSFLSLQSQYAASYGIQVEVTRSYNMSPTFRNGYYGTDWQSGDSTAIASKRIPCRIPYLPRYRLRLNPFKILDMIGLIIQRK